MPSISKTTGGAAPAQGFTDSAGTLEEQGLPPMTRARPFAWLLVTTGVIGWIASGILVLEKLETLKDANYTTVCDVNPWISCGQVMQTWQSSVFGFPNMFIGIVAFAIIITTGMGLLAGATFGRWYWLGLQTGVTLGFIFVIWLWSQALYDIHVLCPFCMVVWAAMIPLFVWVTVRNVSHKVIPVPAGLAKTLGDYGWIITALLYVAVIASIFFAFLNMFVGNGSM
ncbi:vitamin K epoxide reductase family protein [Arthrobacter sp.]|uniref:vitamin K epoxide reductase family protein n=1 Tax=Arthrobacter sp. TaxID=1667 RepID=UPI002811AF27|nr:vitamin K epoxide reductase family protein [Arthrobacter sp.]